MCEKLLKNKTIPLIPAAGISSNVMAFILFILYLIFIIHIIDYSIIMYYLLWNTISFGRFHWTILFFGTFVFPIYTSSSKKENQAVSLWISYPHWLCTNQNAFHVNESISGTHINETTMKCQIIIVALTFTINPSVYVVVSLLVPCYQASLHRRST